LSNGTWFLALALRGPFDAAASGSATVGMVARMKAFDRDADSTTGDWWRVLIDDDAPDYMPLRWRRVSPGRSRSRSRRRERWATRSTAVCRRLQPAPGRERAVRVPNSYRIKQG
jgi:hypothetical protein